MQELNVREMELEAGWNRKMYWEGVGLVALGWGISWIPGIDIVSPGLVGGGITMCVRGATN